MDFFRLPDEERERLYERGIDQVVGIDLYAGLLHSLHDTRRVASPESDFQIREQERRRALTTQLGLPEDGGPQARDDLEMLRLLDNLSLFLCLAPPGVTEDSRPDWLDPATFARTPDGRALTLRWENDGRLEIDPFPFEESIELTIPFRGLPAVHYPDEESLHRCFEQAGEVRWTITIAPASRNASRSAGREDPSPAGPWATTHPRGRRLVIIGAGFGGLEAAKRLRGSELEVLVMDRNNYHLFQPLLYQVATAGLEPESIAYPVRSIFRRSSNVHFRLAEITSIDRCRKRVHGDFGSAAYDKLLVASGSSTNFFGNRSLEGKTLEIKSLNNAVDIRNQVLGVFEEAVGMEEGPDRDAMTRIVVVGGGPTGVELAGAFCELVHHALDRDFPTVDLSKVEILLIEATDHLLDGFHPGLCEEARRRLERMGVEVRTDAKVVHVEGDRVDFENGETLRARTVVWSAGVKASPLAHELTDSPAKGGRVPVTPALHLPDDPDVFVVGDLAHLEPGYPMMAPVAIQQARTVADNLQRQLEGRPLRPFRYTDRGMMATIGRKAAVATVFGRPIKGHPAWLVWLIVHLVWLIGFRNRLVVMINWIFRYLRYEQGVRLITSRAERSSRRGVCIHRTDSPARPTSSASDEEASDRSHTRLDRPAPRECRTRSSCGG
jgi:NADH dehydrogenase